MSTINEIAKEAHKNAVKREVYGVDSEGAILDKIREEADELEQAFFCADKPNIERYEISMGHGMSKKAAFEKYIKNTQADELADIIITASAAAMELGIDIEKHIELKIGYNKIR